MHQVHLQRFALKDVKQIFLCFVLCFAKESGSVGRDKLFLAKKNEYTKITRVSTLCRFSDNNSNEAGEGGRIVGGRNFV